MNNGNVIKSFLSRRIKSSELSGHQKNAMHAFFKGAVKSGSLMPTKVGRSVATLGKKKIRQSSGAQRMCEFFNNKALKISALSKILLALFLYRIQGTTSIVLAIDWTVIRNKFYLFSVSLVENEGRSIPILFGGFLKLAKTGDETMPMIEQKVLGEVLDAVPEGIEVYVLADRGFDSPKTLRFIANRKVFYVIRASVGTWIKNHRGKRRKVKHSLVKRRGVAAYRNILYSETYPVTTNLLCVWNYKQKEPWLLLTNDPFLSMKAAANLYAKRMRIEEMFKSLKNEQTGFDVKKVRIRSIDNWLRFMLVSSILFNVLYHVGEQLREIPRIEQHFSVSSRPPKKQAWIFAIYTLAQLVLVSECIQLRHRGGALFFRENRAQEWKSF